MKKTTDYVEDAWKSARQFADPGYKRDYVIGYLRGIIRMMEEANAMAEEHKGMGGLSFDYEINSHIMDCDEMLSEIERDDDDNERSDKRTGCGTGEGSIDDGLSEER